MDIAQSLSLFSADRLPLALSAVVLSMLIGIIYKSSVPLLWQGISLAMGGLGDRLDRKQRKRPDLLFRGALLLAVLLAVNMLVFKAAQSVTYYIPYPVIMDIILITLCLSTSAVWAMQYNIYKAIKNNAVGQGAYYNLAHSARLNLSAADNFTITRAAITHSAVMMLHGFIAPLFWYIALGGPALWLYATAAAFSWRFGKSGSGTGFAVLAQALRDVMDIIPAFIAAITIKIAALITPGAKMGKPIKGRPTIAAFATALNISLGGVFQDITGSAIKGDWVGPAKATAQCNPTHLKRAVYLSVISHIIIILALLLAYLGNNGISPTFMLDFMR